MFDYLKGFIYHMVHKDNLPGIFTRRAILSKIMMNQEQLTHRSIAFEDVQNIRDRIFVRDPIADTERELHSYVPFYFVARTPMLYVQYRNEIQDEIVYFEVERTILEEDGVIFTDGNATNQQLSQSAVERVVITPAIHPEEICKRIYLPDRPYGTNTNVSNFYANVSYLDRLDWTAINNEWYGDFEKKWRKQAEVLVPNLVPLGKVAGITVKNHTMAKMVNALIEKQGLLGRIPLAKVKPYLYFP